MYMPCIYTHIDRKIDSEREEKRKDITTLQDVTSHTLLETYDQGLKHFETQKYIKAFPDVTYQTNLEIFELVLEKFNQNREEFCNLSD